MKKSAGNCCWIVIVVISLQLLTEAEGQSLPETEIEGSQCFDPSRTIYGWCSSNERIAVLSVKHGVKTTAPTCSDYTTTCCELSYDGTDSTYERTCCFPATGDCTFDFTNTDIHDACTGRSYCLPTTQNQAADTQCAAWFHISSTYNILNYYCIPETRIQTMCDSGTVTATGSPVYLLNQNYPSGISSTDTSCTCSVQAADCSASIIMYTVHRNLDCSQSLTITDGTGTSAKIIDCSDNDGYTITTEQIMSAYLKIKLANSAATDTGMFWIGFEGSTSGQLTVTCPATDGDACITTTTTTTTTTTPTTTTTTSVTTTKATEPGGEQESDQTKTLIGLSVALGIAVLGVICMSAVVAYLLMSPSRHHTNGNDVGQHVDAEKPRKQLAQNGSLPENGPVPGSVETVPVSAGSSPGSAGTVPVSVGNNPGSAGTGDEARVSSPETMVSHRSQDTDGRSVREIKVQSQDRSASWEPEVPGSAWPPSPDPDGRMTPVVGQHAETEKPRKQLAQNGPLPENGPVPGSVETVPVSGTVPVSVGNNPGSAGTGEEARVSSPETMVSHRSQDTDGRSVREIKVQSQDRSASWEPEVPGSAWPPSPDPNGRMTPISLAQSRCHTPGDVVGEIERYFDQTSTLDMVSMASEETFYH